jgi:hypothetical protein
MPPGAHDVLVERYELLGEIGRGTLGRVHRARQDDLDRIVALKELVALRAADAAVAERFVVELLDVARALEHPNIVAVYDAFAHDGTPYVAMELLERGSLRPYLRQVTLAQAAGVLEGVLAALAHAEREGIAHGDLRAEHVLVTHDGRVKLADFGIADAARHMLASGSEESATARDDLHAAGLVAAELLAGGPPLPALEGWMRGMVAGDRRSAAEAWDELEEIVVELLGPRWRRRSRLGPPPEPLGPPVPRQGTAAGFVPLAAPVVAAPSPEPRAGVNGAPAAALGVEALANGEAPPSPPAAADEPAPASPDVPGADPPLDVGSSAGDASSFGSTLPAAGGLPHGHAVDELAIYELAGMVLAASGDEPVADERASTGEPMAAAAEAAGTDEPLAANERPSTADSSPAAGAPVAADSSPAAGAPVDGGSSPAADSPLDAASSAPTGSSGVAPRRRRRGVFALVLLAGVVGAAVGGYVLGGRGGEPVRMVAAPAGEVSVRVPSTYRRLAAPPTVPGLELEGAVAFASGRTVVIVGTARSEHPTLLPRGFRRALGLAGGEVPDRRAVRLGAGGLQAYRYAGLRPAGSERSITLYAAPATIGVPTVVCLAGPAAACNAVAASLALRAGGGFPVGPDPAFAARLDEALAELRAAIRTRRRALRAAGATGGAQAAAAAGIERAHAAAARALRNAAASPADRGLNARLRARLRALADAWGVAAAEAGAVDAAGFSAAQPRITAAERALRRALGRLRDAGYTVR